MKLENSDLDDEKAAELDRLVRVARTRQPPPNVTRRVAQRLSAAGALAATATTASTEALPVGRLGAAKLAGALALLGLGCVVFVSTTRSAEPAAPSASPVAMPTAPPLPPPSAVDDTPSIAVDALPSLAATAELPKERPHAVAPRTPSRNLPAPAASPKPEAEVVLIRRARFALPTDPAGALGILEEHARTFSNGELAQEREVMAVEALAHLDRKAEAKRRAQALVGRFPRTPYVPRLEAALGEQLQPTVPANTAR
jgi:hypothetical protein